MIPELPEDLLHMFCAELRSREDLATLFNFSVASKRIAPVALANLYRSLSQTQALDEEGEGLSFVQKQAIMWRSIILSTTNETLFPYCKYLRSIDLRDLQYLLEDSKFSGKVENYFFGGSLASMRHQTEVQFKQRKIKRLDYRAILHSVGDAIIPKNAILEQLSGSFSSQALLRWIPHLSRLNRLELGEGEALGDVAVHEAIRKHCPNFNGLSMYAWMTPDSDRLLGSFISGLSPQSLKSFVTFSDCRTSTETCLALNDHGNSLQHLQLNFSQETISALGLLRGCTALETVNLEIPSSVDLEQFHNDVFTEIIAWLVDCKSLRSITLTEFKSAPTILLPLLLSDIRFKEITVPSTRSSYNIKDARDFHSALANQKSLVGLHLRGEGEDAILEDIETLVDAICQLTNLQLLRLQGISQNFSDKDVIRVLSALPQLEEVYLDGYGLTDAVLEPVANLTKLRRITFLATTTFTADGLLDLISRLGPGNDGLVLSIDMADPWTAPLISEPELDMVRRNLWDKASGRLDYEPLRDPNVSEFEQSDSE